MCSEFLYEYMRTFVDLEEYNSLEFVITTGHCTFEDEGFIMTFESKYKREDYFWDKILFLLVKTYSLPDSNHYQFTGDESFRKLIGKEYNILQLKCKYR